MESLNIGRAAEQWKQVLEEAATKKSYVNIKGEKVAKSERSSVEEIVKKSQQVIENLQKSFSESGAEITPEQRKECVELTDEIAKYTKVLIEAREAKRNRAGKKLARAAGWIGSAILTAFFGIGIILGKKLAESNKEFAKEIDELKQQTNSLSERFTEQFANDAIKNLKESQGLIEHNGYLCWMPAKEGETPISTRQNIQKLRKSLKTQYKIALSKNIKISIGLKTGRVKPPEGNEKPNWARVHVEINFAGKVEHVSSRVTKLGQGNFGIVHEYKIEDSSPSKEISQTEIIKFAQPKLSVNLKIAEKDVQNEVRITNYICDKLEEVAKESKTVRGLPEGRGHLFIAISGEKIQPSRRGTVSQEVKFGYRAHQYSGDAELSLRKEKDWRNKEGWDETKVVDGLCQIAEGLDFLHKIGVYHGDFKPGNVLRDDKKHTFHISDYGGAKFGNELVEEVDGKKVCTPMTLTKEYWIEKIPGSAYKGDFISEEEDEKTVRAYRDAFAYGVSMYQILTGYHLAHPFELTKEGFPDLSKIKTKEQIMNSIGKFITSEEKKEQFAQLILDIINPDSADALNMEQIVARFKLIQNK